MEKLSDDEKNKYVLYICDNINELKINNRKEILQMIMYSSIDLEKIIEKGNGTQIKLVDINDNLLRNIYNYIYNKFETDHGSN